MITTKATFELPAIDWEIGDLLDCDPDERMKVFDADGEDKEGNKYSGSAYYFCDVFDNIEGVEKL